jgi:ferredoxin-type protein NapG
MGLAVLVDEEELPELPGPALRRRATACAPLIDKAITLQKVDATRAATGTQCSCPRVHARRCTGCGKCEKSPARWKQASDFKDAAAAAGAGRRLGAHYRLGLEAANARPAARH